jgi:hypothetical protein
MDIVEWQTRKVRTAASLCYYRAVFIWHNQKACLLADADLANPEGKVKEIKLLQRILQALTGSEEIVLQENTLTSQADIMLRENRQNLLECDITQLILMGNKIKQFYLSHAGLHDPNRTVINTHSLRQLLQEPLLKAETWSTLQKNEPYPVNSIHPE